MGGIVDDEIGVKFPLEGRIYGEVSGWLTVIGIFIAIVGVIIGIAGNSIFDYQSTVNDLLSGLNEEKIWEKDTYMHTVLHGYWFLSILHTGDGIAMFGITTVVYGGIVGMICLLASMFRSREVLFYKKGLYTILATVILSVMLLLAWEASLH